MKLPYMLDYDIYLIENYLFEKGIRERQSKVVPLPANAPDHYRLYFATSQGNITLGIDNPTASHVLFIKGMAAEQSGSCFIFLVKGTHIADVLTPDADTLLFAASVFVTPNICSPLLEPVVQQINSLWRSPDALKSSGAFHLADASDSEILDFLYGGQS